MSDVERFALSPTLETSELSSPTALRIVKTARELFFSEGFSEVSTDKLCKAAGVSKSSLYKYFGDMSGVLSAVVRSEGDVITAGLMPEPRDEDEFWSSLMDYGCNLLTLLSQRHCIEFDRMLHEQSRKHPEVSRLFYDAGYGRSHIEVTAMIKFGKQQGFVKKAQSSEQLADHLLCIWEGLAYVRTRLGLTQTPFRDPQARARDGIQALFERTPNSVTSQASDSICPSSACVDAL